MKEEFSCPDFCTPEEHRQLELAQWRYEHLIGMVYIGEEVSAWPGAGVLQSDRETFGYLDRVDEHGVKGNDRDNSFFASAVTGIDPEACLQWIEEYNNNDPYYIGNSK